MKSRQLIIGAVLGLMMAGHAAASTTRTNLGALPEVDFGIAGDARAVSRSFREIGRLSYLDTSGAELINPAHLVTASLKWSKTAGSATQGASALDRHTFADLTPGAHAAAIFGPTKHVGGYGARYRASVAAVPEVETWLMLLIGLGLVAYQLHRKQKALGQQVLNDEAMSSA